ncbi:unnamed protein product [Closterium sp. NIES-53]
MVGTALAVLHGAIPPSMLLPSLARHSRIVLPLAPPQGLLLADCSFMPFRAPKLPGNKSSSSAAELEVPQSSAPLEAESTNRFKQQQQQQQQQQEALRLYTQWHSALSPLHTSQPALSVSPLSSPPSSSPSSQSSSPSSPPSLHMSPAVCERVEVFSQHHVLPAMLQWLDAGGEPWSGWEENLLAYQWVCEEEEREVVEGYAKWMQGRAERGY